MSDFENFGDFLRGYIPKAPAPKEDYHQRQCERMNNIVGNLNDIDGYNCKLCLNRGYSHIVKDSEVVMRLCKCDKARKSIMNLEASGLKDVLTNYTFDKYIAQEQWQKDIKEKAIQFCKDENAKWFYVGGMSGSGKSHICSAIAIELMRRGLSCKYMKWVDETNLLKQRRYNDFEEIIEQYKECDILYIDDFLKVQAGEEPLPADIRIGFEILNSRYISKKLTIISSEFSIDKAMKFDPATIGRIVELTGIYKFTVENDKSKNYRLK